MIAASESSHLGPGLGDSRPIKPATDPQFYEKWGEQDFINSTEKKPKSSRGAGGGGGNAGNGGTGSGGSGMGGSPGVGSGGVGASGSSPASGVYVSPSVAADSIGYQRQSPAMLVKEIREQGSAPDPYDTIIIAPQ